MKAADESPLYTTVQLALASAALPETELHINNLKLAAAIPKPSPEGRKNG